MITSEQTIATVKEYYGKILKTKADLQTTACCTAEAMPLYAREVAKLIHPEVIEKFYGCGSPIPMALEGKTVLDLGSGTGRDVYILSKLVGPKGRVIGIDMTDEQIAIAKKHEAYHMDAFGFAKSNVEFHKGYIEDLQTAGIATNSVDLVVSNCVINLSPEKKRVFAEIFRVLKPGGELYFSDVFSNRRLPKNIQQDDVMIGECLGGAMYTEDFRRLLGELGCPDLRVCSKNKIELTNPRIAEMAGVIEFYSMTVRAFKIDLEDRCEDYGQVAYYNGTIDGAPQYFDLDDHHRLEKNKPLLVCSNTANMLSKTRYKSHFKIIGDTSIHFGLFDCTPATTSSAAVTNPAACC